jgi:hypothetical protein
VLFDRRIFDDLSHVKDTGDPDSHTIAKSECARIVPQRGLGGVPVTLHQQIQVDPNVAVSVQALQPFQVTQVGLPPVQTGVIYQSPQQVREADQGSCLGVRSDVVSLDLHNCREVVPETLRVQKR